MNVDPEEFKSKDLIDDDGTVNGKTVRGKIQLQK